MEERVGKWLARRHTRRPGQPYEYVMGRGDHFAMTPNRGQATRYDTKEEAEERFSYYTRQEDWEVIEVFN